MSSHLQNFWRYMDRGHNQNAHVLLLLLIDSLLMCILQYL